MRADRPRCEDDGRTDDRLWVRGEAGVARKGAEGEGRWANHGEWCDGKVEAAGREGGARTINTWAPSIPSVVFHLLRAHPPTDVSASSPRRRSPFLRPSVSRASIPVANGHLPSPKAHPTQCASPASCCSSYRHPSPGYGQPTHHATFARSTPPCFPSSRGRIRRRGGVSPGDIWGGCWCRGRPGRRASKYRDGRMRGCMC